MIKLLKNSSFKEYCLVFLGAFILAFAYAFFIAPYNIVTGGVFGLSIIIEELTNKITLGVIALSINIPLLLWGTNSLGKNIGFKTAFFMLVSSFLLDFLLLLTKNKIVVESILLSSVFGGILIGVSIFLVKKAGATTGGQDIVSRIISRKVNIEFNHLILIIDAFIILMGFLFLKIILWQLTV